MENTQQNVPIIWMNDFCFNPKTKIIEMLSQPSTLKYLRLSLIFEYLHILPQHSGVEPWDGNDTKIKDNRKYFNHKASTTFQ